MMMMMSRCRSASAVSRCKGHGTSPCLFCRRQRCGDEGCSILGGVVTIAKESKLAKWESLGSKAIAEDGAAGNPIMCRNLTMVRLPCYEDSEGDTGSPSLQCFSVMQALFHPPSPLLFHSILEKFAAVNVSSTSQASLSICAVPTN